MGLQGELPGFIPTVNSRRKKAASMVRRRIIREDLESPILQT
jgi:hypothetical protein